jgi:hypothetical protein
MHKQGFGQDYFIDILKEIPTKFILYFYELATNFYEFWNSILISKNLKGNEIWKWDNR